MTKDMAAWAKEARELLKSQGFVSTVGTSWSKQGAPIVVVDVPPGVSTDDVKGSLAGLEPDVLVRTAARRTRAQDG